MDTTYINADDFNLPPINKKVKMIIHILGSIEYCTTIGYYDEAGWHCPYDSIPTGYKVMGWKELNN
jgi:hypothetical protein